MSPYLIVDPGKMTGWGYLFAVRGQTPLFQGAENPHFEFLCEAERIIRGGLVSGVVCESFSVTDRTAKLSNERFWSLEQIGALRYFCGTMGTPYVEQTPSEAKSFATNAKLRKLDEITDPTDTPFGWYAGNKGEAGHRRDAARHALVYGIRNHLIDARSLL